MHNHVIGSRVNQGFLQILVFKPVDQTLNVVDLVLDLGNLNNCLHFGFQLLNRGEEFARLLFDIHATSQVANVFLTMHLVQSLGNGVSVADRMDFVHKRVLLPETSKTAVSESLEDTAQKCFLLILI